MCQIKPLVPGHSMTQDQQGWQNLGKHSAHPISSVRLLLCQGAGSQAGSEILKVKVCIRLLAVSRSTTWLGSCLSGHIKIMW